MQRNRGRRIGFDLGRVFTNGTEADLLRPVDGRSRHSFLGIPSVPGSFRTALRLTRRYGGAWVISQCSESVEHKVRAWLENHRFFDSTGIVREDVHFCRTNAEKAPIAARLRLTDFVDDKLDVLLDMKGVVPRRFLFRADDYDLRRAAQEPAIVVVRPVWRDLFCVLSAASAERRA